MNKSKSIPGIYTFLPDYVVVLGDVRKTSMFLRKISIYIDVFDVFFFIFSKYLSFGEILGISFKKFW